MKKFLKRENILILLILGLIGHNIFLQTKIEETLDVTHAAVYAANQAERKAGAAVSYSRDAVSYASQAADYALEAANNSEDASNYAYDANRNSFGRQCWRCP